MTIVTPLGAGTRRLRAGDTQRSVIAVCGARKLVRAVVASILSRESEPNFSLLVDGASSVLVLS